LDLRAGAGVGGIMTKFTQTIEASKTKSWIVLLLSICNETLAVTLIKKAQETKSARLMAVAIGIYIITLFGFALTLTQIDVSIAYAVWGALGSCIVTCAGILLFHESYSFKKLACILCIIVGVVGLNLLDET
jgi:multidrug transporter EmrE-like cation transporter